MHAVKSLGDYHCRRRSGLLLFLLFLLLAGTILVAAIRPSASVKAPLFPTVFHRARRRGRVHYYRVPNKITPTCYNNNRHTHTHALSPRRTQRSHGRRTRFSGRFSSERSRPPPPRVQPQCHVVVFVVVVVDVDRRKHTLTHTHAVHRTTCVRASSAVRSR